MGQPALLPSAYSVSTFTKGPGLSWLHLRRSTGSRAQGSREPAHSQRLLGTCYAPSPCQAPRIHEEQEAQPLPLVRSRRWGRRVKGNEGRRLQSPCEPQTQLSPVRGGKRFGSFLIRRPSLLGPRGRHSWGRDAQVHRKPHPLQLCSAGLQTGSERPSFQDRDSGNTAPAGTDPRSRTRGVARRRLGLPLAPGWAALLRGGEGQAPSRGMEMSPSQRVQARQVHGSVLERIGHSTHLHSARSTVESHPGLRPLIAGAASAVQGCDRCQE